MEGRSPREKKYIYRHIYVQINSPTIKETAGAKTLFIYWPYLQNHPTDREETEKLGTLDREWRLCHVPPKLPQLGSYKLAAVVVVACGLFTFFWWKLA